MRSHALRLAAERLGGMRALREELEVPTEQLLRWMTGREPVPEEVFIQVLNVVLRPEPLRAGGRGPSDAV